MSVARSAIANLRPHHWLKNLLLFVPTLAAHSFGVHNFVYPTIAFASFCCASSAGYVFNDLRDLGNDRGHPHKRYRPLAAGQISPVQATITGLLAVLLAISLALLLPPLFLVFVMGYFCLSLSYSLWLKRIMIVDVVVLACLYGFRVVAGGTGLDRPVSYWLMAFSLFLFFNLALVKRCSELVDTIQRQAGVPPGRDYILDDLPVLQALAAASGMVAVLVFALYVDSNAVSTLYRHPSRLWLICIVLIAWISRIMLLTARGKMHHDPIVFALQDKFSVAALAITSAIALASI